MTTTSHDAPFRSTIARTSDALLNGWNVTYHNNSDVVTAWRMDGGALMEAEGTVESTMISSSVETLDFHATRTRILTGAVHPKTGDPTDQPTSWWTSDW